MTKRHYERLTKSAKMIASRGIDNAARFASLREIGPDEVSAVKGSGTDAHRVVMILVNKCLPAEGCRINKCRCSCVPDSDSNHCIVHNKKDWTQ